MREITGTGRPFDERLGTGGFLPHGGRDLDPPLPVTKTGWDTRHSRTHQKSTRLREESQAKHRASEATSDAQASLNRTPGPSTGCSNNATARDRLTPGHPLQGMPCRGTSLGENGVRPLTGVDLVNLNLNLRRRPIRHLRRYSASPCRQRLRSQLFSANYSTSSSR